MDMDMIYKADNSLVDLTPPENGKYTKTQLELFVEGPFRFYNLSDTRVMVARVYSCFDAPRLNLLATLLTARAGYTEIIMGNALVCRREHIFEE